MASRRKTNDPETPRRPPATTPRDRENQLVELAMNLAEKQIREGTASSQVLSHFLKAGSSRDELELERIRHQNELAKAQIDALASQVRTEELYKKALSAMATYSGRPEPEDPDEYQG